MAATRQIEIYATKDQVVILGHVIPRPMNISIGQWLDFWELICASAKMASE